MFKCRCIVNTTTGPSGGTIFRLLANCFLLFCRDLAVFVFQTRLAYIQNLIESRHGIQHVPPLFFCFILKMVVQMGYMYISIERLSATEF